ncbi:MAG: DNA methyltransferase, partial [Candidatus Gastranaerophilales bacterium]|nr:DNA methyltransferase [Candidatus Gastranaerophilales bacterium]
MGLAESLQNEESTLKKTKSYNDIDLTNWKDYDFVETGTLWNFQNRAKGNGHKYDYHGNYIPQIASQLFTRYTKQEDVILDLFLGSGTSAIEAVNMDRKCIGVELKEDMAEYVNDKFEKEQLGTAVQIINADSSSEEAKTIIDKQLNEWGKEKAQFLVLHPPYADIIKFSDKKEDLSNAETTDEFVKMFAKVAKNGYDSLEKGRYSALIIGDKYKKGELIPLSFLCMKKMNEIGFKTKSIIVKNIEGNEKGKGKDANLWRYRALA